MSSVAVNFKKSRPIEIIEYQERWVVEFQEVAGRIRTAVGDTALRIDHIGSTSVPGLGAKDIIDIQITVADLSHCTDFENRMIANDFIENGNVHYDNFFGDDLSPGTELRKKYFREPANSRRCHIHVREAGSFNQRYAILFRDYLRSKHSARNTYQILKQRLSQLFPDSIEGYLFIKDPLMDIIYTAAEEWAIRTKWEPSKETL